MFPRNLVLALVLVLVLLAGLGAATYHLLPPQPQPTESKWTWWSATVDDKLLVIIATHGEKTAVSIANMAKEDILLCWDDDGDGRVDRMFRNGKRDEESLVNEKERAKINQRFASLKEKYCRPEFLDPNGGKNLQDLKPVDLTVAARAQPRRELAARGRPFRLFIFYPSTSIYQSQRGGQTRALSALCIFLPGRSGWSE